MIYTTYFNNIKNLPDNIFPIAICGKCPKDWNGLKYSKLAPKKSFWLEWEKTKDNKYYEKHFKLEVLDCFENPIDCLNELYELLPLNIKESMKIVNCPPWSNPFYHIALVCYENPNDFCHRHLVSKWINDSFKAEIVKEY